MSRVDGLRDVVAGALLDRTEMLSRRLSELGVPHALIGGLAVGVHGVPRATKDVDFLVGDEAFASMKPLVVYRDELAELVRIAETDFLSVPPKYPGLARDLSTTGDIPVISLPGLVLMKLDAFRPRDRDDVRRLLAIHPGQLRNVRDYLMKEAPDLVNRLGEVLGGGLKPD